MRNRYGMAALAGFAIAAAAAAQAQAPGPGQTGFAPTLETGAYLGILVNPVDEQETTTLQLPPGTGLKVVYIDPQSKAAAVLKENDILQKMDDQVLVNMEQLLVLSRLHKGGESVKFSLYRDGRPTEATVELVEKDVPPVSPRSSFGSFRSYFASGVDREAAMDVMRRLSPNMRGPGGPDQGGRDRGRDGVRRGRGLNRGGDGERQPGAGGATTEPRDRPRTMTQTRASDGGSTTTMSDGGFNLTLIVEAAGGRTLMVTDAAGKQVFAGPVNNDEEKIGIPEKVRPMFDQMDRR